MKRHLVSAALLTVVAAAAAAAAGGCRYNTTGSLPPELKTIAVARLRNESPTPGLEGEVTAAVITALQSQGRLELVGLGDKPDLILTGTIDAYRRSSLRSDVYGDSVEFALEVKATVNVRKADGSDLLKKARVSNLDNEPTSGQVRMTAGRTEAMGRAEAVEDLGRNIVRRIVNSGW